MVKTIEDKYKMVIVKWRDHEGDSGWMDLPDIQKREAPEVSTVGWLVIEDDKYIKLVDSIMSDGTMGGFSLILKECVIDVTELDFIDYPIISKKKQH